MKITLNRTGGFANIPLNIEVDSDTLSQEKQTKLDALLHKVLPFPPTQAEPKPDMHTYSLVVEDGAQAHNLDTNDGAATEEMHELFDFILSVND